MFAYLFVCLKLTGALSTRLVYTYLNSIQNVKPVKLDLSFAIDASIGGVNLNFLMNQ